MNQSENNNTNSNVQPQNNISNQNPNPVNQAAANTQVLYDQYGNPVNVAVVQPVAPTNPQAQTTNQAPPQVVKQVEKTNVVYQQAPPTPPNQPVQQGNVATPNQVPKNEKQPGKIRYFLLILFFIMLLLIVWFLPDIRKYVTDKKMSEQEEVINGTMQCIYEDEDELITTLYTSEFIVENNKLKSYISTVESKGDRGSEESLEKLNQDCELLTKMVKKIPGIKSTCSLNSRKQINRQEIDYGKVNLTKLDTAYAEAGGVVPDYQLDADAREIKKEMTLARYSCIVK